MFVQLEDTPFNKENIACNSDQATSWTKRVRQTSHIQLLGDLKISKAVATIPHIAQQNAV